MEHDSFDCEVCQENFKMIYAFKKHVCSLAHRKKMEEVFQKDSFNSCGIFPFITLLSRKAKKDLKQPIIGLSLLTLCFSPGTKNPFYLCHVCEEKCRSEMILSHLTSSDHCSNYFSYTNPNVLSYSWMPSMDMRVSLKAEVKKEINKTGSGRFKMLELLYNLFKTLERSTYSEVMSTLSQNEKLLQLMRAVNPKRTMIQTYQRDKNRKHPLLGMQHLVECVCVGTTERRHYLCTLCNLTVATHMIIKHVLSFDHIFCYFKVWHPSTLLSKECYKSYNNAFVSMILDYAKQTEEIHGTSNADMKQVSLEPAKFTSVNFTCYAEALKVLESITKENNENSLITSVKPGNKLECHPSTKLSPFLFKLRCQDCNMIFEHISEYKEHLSKEIHKQMLNKLFRKVEGADGYDQKAAVHTPRLGLYEFLKEKWKENEPAIGVHLVVTCICSQAEAKPIYMCFACQDCFPESLLRQHFYSRKHLVRTLLYQNPWRLPFAWKTRLEPTVLKSMAWEEEKERGPKQMTMKVFDIPHWMFRGSSPSYQEVMTSLDLQHVHLKREVPPCETNSKLQQNERFPVLGQQFLVMHNVCVRRQESLEKSFLCLLCKRRLSEEECYAHVFSWEHVETFLDRFHPGSLNSSTNAETLLDLAKQAARIHRVSHVQEIRLDKPIWEPCTYQIAISILKSAKKRDGTGNLEPPIIPTMKLIPREIVKEVDKGRVKGNSQENSRMIERPEKEKSQKSTDSSETTPRISVEVSAKISDTDSVERGENGADKETPTLSEKESEKRKEVSSTTSSEETADGITYRVIKEETIEEPPVNKPSGETLETCQTTDKADKTEAAEESIGGGKDVLTQQKNYIYKENEKKRPRVMMENSEEEPCPDGNVEKEKYQKKQRINSIQDVSYEETQHLLSGKQKEVTTIDERESGKPSQETSNDKESSDVNNQQAAHLWQYVKRTSREPVVGLGALIECNFDQHDPIYLCECCSVKIQDTDIISHVTGADHQKMYLMGLQKLSPQPEKHQGKDIREMAALAEQANGCGEAEVFDLDEEIYTNLSKQNFESAIQTIKALQAQQGSCAELPSTSALSADQSVNSSVTLHAQHSHVTDDSPVVKMEVEDGSEDPESQTSSGTAAVFVISKITSKTTENPLESTENVKMTQVKEFDSADNASNHLPASKSSEDASNLHVSTSWTNTTRLHSDLTGNDLKTEIISNTTLEPFNIAATSKIADTLQYPTTLDSAVMTAPSKGPAKSSSSSSDTPELTATISSLKASTSNCTTTTPATFKSSTTDYKCAATTSKEITANPSSSTSSKIEKASQTMAASVICENTEASATTVVKKDSVGPNVDVAPNIPKSNARTASPQTGLMSGRSENKNLPKEPSHTSTSEPKSMEGPPAIGINQLIAVTCERRQQVYCQLCSIRLRKPQHLISHNHQLNYVKMTFPNWTATTTKLKKKLHEMVCYLAEIEKDIGYLQMTRREVKNDVYKELAALPEDKALERLRAMMGHQSSQGSSTGDNAKVLSLQVALPSPSEVSTPDDGMCTPKNEMAGDPTNNQSEQENRQVQENKSISKNKGNPAAVQSDRAQSPICSGPEANSQISDQLHLRPTFIKNEPITTNIQDTDIAVIGKQETFGSDVQFEAKGGVTHEMKNPAVTIVIPQGCADPCASDSESAARFPRTSDTFPESTETKQQQNRSDPVIQDAQTMLLCTQKTTPVKFVNPDPLPSAASEKTEQQNLEKPSQKAKYVTKHSGSSQGPGRSGPSQTLSIGERGRGSSNLSTYLDVMGFKSVIGLGLVWECRGGIKDTLFLCESCEKTLFSSDICQHMISVAHQLKYVMRQYPQYMWFWLEKDLLEYMKLDILKGVVQMLSERESYNKMDAQVIQLREDFYNYIRTAPFSEALKMVQHIKKEPKLHCLAISALQETDQQPQGQQSREESLSTKKQLTQALEIDQRETRQKAEKHHLEGTAVVGDIDRTNVSSKANSVVSPIPGAGKCHSPQETSRSLTMKPELRPPVSQHWRPSAEVQVKQAEMHPEPPSISIVSPKANQTLSVSPRDNCCLTRKRQADTSLETLVGPCFIKPRLNDPVPAKCTHNSQQSIGQSSAESAFGSTPVNPAATSTFLSPEDKDAEHWSNMQDASSGNAAKMADLISLLTFQRSLYRSALNNAKTTTASANNSPESDTERTRDSKYTHASFEMEEIQTSWDSQGSQNNATVIEIPPTTNSLEGPSSTAAPVDLGCENQLSQHASHANYAFSVDNASPEGYLARGNLLLRETEAKAVGTMLPSVETTDSSNPQHRRSVNAQNLFGNVSKFKTSTIHYLATNSNSGQIPQPKDYTETYSSGGCQFPINAIITARQHFTSHQFMGSYNGQDPTAVSRDNQVAHRFSSVPTASSSDTLAASEGYGQHNRMAYVQNGRSEGYTTPNNLPAYTENLYPQVEGYTRGVEHSRQIYPGQQAQYLPLGSMSLEKQQQQQLMQQQRLIQQQQLMQQQQRWLMQPQQQQPYSWTSANTATAGGQGTDQAAHIGAVPLTTSANRSQMFIDLNNYRMQI